MSTTSPNPERIIRRRHTVRILHKRRIPREALLSLWLAIAAATVVFGVWWYSTTSEETARPRPRALADIELLWRCGNGHSFVAAGQPGGRLCLYCDQPAFPVTDYYCPVHGPFQATVQFADTSDGTIRIEKLRLTGREWVSAETGLRCPRCDRRLEHGRRDPLDDPDALNAP